MNQNSASTEFTTTPKKVVNKLPVFDNDRQLESFMSSNFLESLKQMIRITVNTIVRQEMDKFRSEMDDKIYFNGNYNRQMLSTMGKIDNVPIPRFRQSNGFSPSSLSVFDSEQDKFMKLVEQMHLNGISQRKISKLAKDCFGITLSKNRVGKVYVDFAKKEEMNINSQKLDDNFDYLILDGVYVKTKGYGWDNNKAVLLCALGIRPDGKRQIIGFSFARAEDYESWLELVDNIQGRGLVGKTLKLIIADGHKAIKSVARFCFKTIPFQSCVSHKCRNVLIKTKHKNKQAMADDLKKVFNQNTREEAIVQAKSLCKKWYQIEPTAVEVFRSNLLTCFTYYQFPKDSWTKIRTSNALEREFRELRRRIKVFDNCFNHQQSTENYANTIFSNLNQTYPAYQFLHTKA
ncbi:MAG TPA: IS256 family transposase [Candidatus Dojkabacteria bacterium]|nr:IS256 family transposase [Candidatus Dojkabacteria bacterium]